MPTAELSLHQLPLNTPVPFEKDGMKIVLIRTAQTVVAFEDVCPHAFWPLSAGTFRDGVLECPGHAWEFSVETGKCQEGPAYCLNPVAVTVTGEAVRLVWEGKNALPARNCPRESSMVSQASQD